MSKVRSDPFITLAISGPKADANPYRFSSKPVHPASGKYDYLYRWYSPVLQRWPNQDPIGELGGLNLYGFVGNDSINKVDPNGKIVWFIPIIAAGATLYAVGWNLWEQHESMKIRAEIARERAGRGDIGSLGTLGQNRVRVDIQEIAPLAKDLASFGSPMVSASPFGPVAEPEDAIVNLANLVTDYEGTWDGFKVTYKAAINAAKSGCDRLFSNQPPAPKPVIYIGPYVPPAPAPGVYMGSYVPPAPTPGVYMGPNPSK